MYRRYAKRFLDFTLSLIALILLSPLMISVAVWLHFANRGAGIFFVQPRPGKNAEIFNCLKFKTMNDSKAPDGKLLDDAHRLTPTGRFLRSTSIDELPQLINVLRGDMSLVGPRPLLIEYLPFYNKEQMRRHEVRPGITGWAQCNGRNSITWKQKFELDVWYVDHLSFTTDLRIIISTIKKVILRSDINQAGQATYEPFNGKN